MGQIFLLIFMLFNLIVLLNLVIAILANTYSELSEYSLGLYYDSLIQEIQLKQSHKFYGALTCTYQIMSPIGLLLVPFMAILAFIKNNSRELALLNHIANLALYFPVSILLLVIFVTLNLASLPFAYLAAIYTKVKLFFNFWRTSRE